MCPRPQHPPDNLLVKLFCQLIFKSLPVDFLPGIIFNSSSKMCATKHCPSSQFNGWGKLIGNSKLMTKRSSGAGVTVSSKCWQRVQVYSKHPYKFSSKYTFWSVAKKVSLLPTRFLPILVNLFNQIQLFLSV